MTVQVPFRDIASHVESPVGSHAKFEAVHRSGSGAVAVNAVPVGVPDRHTPGNNHSPDHSPAVAGSLLPFEDGRQAFPTEAAIGGSLVPGNASYRLLGRI